MIKNLEADHRRFLLVDQGVGPIIVNFAINAGIAWAMFRTAASVPLWGQSSIAGDTIATAFMLPLLTALIVGKVVDHQVGNGKLRALKPVALPASSLAFRASYQKGVLLGLVSVVLAAAPIVWVLANFGPAELERDPFILFKATFGAALGAVVTPLLGWWALMHASRRHGA